MKKSSEGSSFHLSSNYIYSTRIRPDSLQCHKVKFEDFSNSNRILCRTTHCFVLDVLDVPVAKRLLKQCSQLLEPTLVSLPSPFLVSLFVFRFCLFRRTPSFEIHYLFAYFCSISYWFILNVLFSCLIFRKMSIHTQISCSFPCR